MVTLQWDVNVPQPMPQGKALGVDVGLTVRVVGDTKEKFLKFSSPGKHLVNREGDVSRNRENLFSVRVKVPSPRYRVDSIVSSFKDW